MIDVCHLYIRDQIAVVCWFIFSIFIGFRSTPILKSFQLINFHSILITSNLTTVIFHHASYQSWLSFHCRTYNLCSMRDLRLYSLPSSWIQAFFWLAFHRDPSSSPYWRISLSATDIQQTFRGTG